MISGEVSAPFVGIVEEVPPPALTCPAPPSKPEIILNFENKTPVFSSAKSSRELGQITTSTVVSHHRDEVFLTGGITSSNISSRIQMSFARAGWEGEKRGCAYPHKVEVTIVYAPEVFIASGYAPGSCRYQTTMQHELRHVNTDVITLNEFMPFVKKTLQQSLDAIPAPTPQLPPVMDQKEAAMLEGVKAALAQAMTTMNISRMQRQQLIDTRQEYMRMTNACPNERP